MKSLVLSCCILPGKRWVAAQSFLTSAKESKYRRCVCCVYTSSPVALHTCVHVLLYQNCRRQLQNRYSTAAISKLFHHRAPKLYRKNPTTSPCPSSSTSLNCNKNIELLKQLYHLSMRQIFQLFVSNVSDLILIQARKRIGCLSLRTRRGVWSSRRFLIEHRLLTKIQFCQDMVRVSSSMFHLSGQS